MKNSYLPSSLYTATSNSNVSSNSHVKLMIIQLDLFFSPCR